MLMAETKATRGQRGIAQNFANQLAQMAVGWHVMLSGPSLIGEPDTGVMKVDAVHATFQWQVIWPAGLSTKSSGCN
jgi:hypothetical protein